ncbi:hypothetical protein ACEPAF_9955 [Sanghuangporus sanghuang]
MTVFTQLFARNSYKLLPKIQHTNFKRSFRWESSNESHPDKALVAKHEPGSEASRFAPIPIVFVGSAALENDRGAFQTLGDRLSQELALRGFECYQFDLPFKKRTNDTAKSILDRMSSHLRLLVQSTGIPFPPILYAERLGCLIAQTYVSSHPLYGLVLDSPPLSCANLASWPGLADRLPLPVPKFTFEPKFPVLVLEELFAGGMLVNSRLVKEGADYMAVCDDTQPGGTGESVESRDVPNRLLALERWIDELGC